MSRVRKNCSILSYLEASLTDFSQETPNFLASAPGLLPNFFELWTGQRTSSNPFFWKVMKRALFDDHSATKVRIFPWKIVCYISSPKIGSRTVTPQNHLSYMKRRKLHCLTKAEKMDYSRKSYAPPPRWPHKQYSLPDFSQKLDVQDKRHWTYKRSSSI